MKRYKKPLLAALGVGLVATATMLAAAFPDDPYIQALTSVLRLVSHILGGVE